MDVKQKTYRSRPRKILKTQLARTTDDNWRQVQFILTENLKEYLPHHISTQLSLARNYDDFVSSIRHYRKQLKNT